MGNKKSTWQDSPLILCGHRKSGTTMLLSLLDNHPQLVTFPPDSGFFYAWYPTYNSDSFTRDEKIQRVIDTMYYNFRLDLEKLEAWDSVFDYESLNKRLRARMEDVEAAPENLLREAIIAWGEATGQAAHHDLKGWVEKTTSTEIYASEVLEWYPNAKMVHVIRDPRDNYSSLKSGWQARYSEQADSIERIRQSMIDRGLLGMKMATQNHKIYGEERYMTIRFEDLTADPRKQMQKIAEFASLEFDESMLFPTYMGLPWKGNNFDGLKFEGVSAVNVGKWKKRIDPEEAYLIEFHFEEELIRWGYEIESTQRQRVDAAREHYKWANFAQQYTVLSGANTYDKAK